MKTKELKIQAIMGGHKKTLALLVFFCLLSFDTRAQNSGFLGKKLLVSASVQGNSNFIPFAIDQPDKKVRLRYFFDWKTCFSADYTVGRRASIGIITHFNKLDYYPVVVEDLAYGNQPSTARYTGEMAQIMDLNVMLIGAQVKIFRKRGIPSPLGIYSKFDAGVISYELIDREGIIGDPGAKLMTNSGYFIGFGLGRQQMLRKNMVLNIEVNTKLSDLMLMIFSPRGTFEEKRTNGNTLRVYYRPYNMIKSSYIFNAQVGLGYMLF